MQKKDREIDSEVGYKFIEYIGSKSKYVRILGESSSVAQSIKLLPCFPSKKIHLFDSSDRIIKTGFYV